MNKRWVSLLIGAFSLLAPACNPQIHPLIEEAPQLKANRLSPQSSASLLLTQYLTKSQERALDAEYASFSTQALTQNYLTRKLRHWLHINNESALVRELVFGCAKHPDTMRNVFAAEQSLYNTIRGLPYLGEAMGQASDLAICVNETLNPEPPSANYTLSDLNMEFAAIPQGTFLMGAPESELDSTNAERPQHLVYVNGFQMQTTEVTQKQWWDVMGSWPIPASNDANSKYPMKYVSWCDIVGASGDPTHCSGVPVGQSFLDKMNAKGQGLFRLPTEAEWEYAARAGTTTAYACGEFVPFSAENANKCPYNMAWLYENNTYGGEIHGAKEVARKLPNSWGLFDMHGNVFEWVQDWEGSYTSSPEVADNPTGPIIGTRRMTRGGGWTNFMARLGRSAERWSSLLPSDRSINYGFRLVRQPE